MNEYVTSGRVTTTDLGGAAPGDVYPILRRGIAIGDVIVDVGTTPATNYRAVRRPIAGGAPAWEQIAGAGGSSFPLENNVSAANFRIGDLGDPAGAGDALSLGYADARYVPLATGTEGAVLAFDGGAWQATAAGTAGMTLLSGGVAISTWGYPDRVGSGTTAVSYVGGARVTRTATAVSYAQLVTDYIIAVTSTAASPTITLLAPASSGGTPTQPAVVIVKDESGGAGSQTINVVAAAGTIDGDPGDTITIDYDSRGYYCDGTSWFKF